MLCDSLTQVQPRNFQKEERRSARVILAGMARHGGGARLLGDGVGGVRTVGKFKSVVEGAIVRGQPECNRQASEQEKPEHRAAQRLPLALIAPDHYNPSSARDGGHSAAIRVAA